MGNRSFILYSPLILLTSIWMVVFTLYYLNPFELPGVRISTLFILFVGISSIYAGYLTPKFLKEGFITTYVPERIDEFPFSISALKKVLLILTLISFVGLTAKMYMFIQELDDVSQYFLAPNYIRKQFIRAELGELSINIPLFKLFSHMGSLNPMTVVLAGVLSALPVNKPRLLPILPVIIAALYSIALLQRVYFVKYYIIWLAVSYLSIYFFPSALKKEAFKIFIKKLFIFFFTIVFFLFFVLILRHFFVLGSDLDKLLNSFYFYIAGPVFLLDKYFISDQPLLYGASLFRSFVHWFVSFDLLEKSVLVPQHYEFYRIYNTIGNTFSYIRIPYEDFGIFGVITISYTWGWVAYWALSKYLSGFSFFRIGFASMIILSFFWSFYGYAWTHSIGIILMFFQLYVIDILFLKKVKIDSKTYS